MSTSVLEQPVSVSKPSVKRAARTPKAISKIVKRPTRIGDLVSHKLPPLKTSLGADPELFLYSVEENRVVSAIGILKQDKHNPIDLGDGIRCYADCTLCEAAMPPSDTPDDMMKMLKTVFSRIQAHIGPNYRLLPQAAHTHTDEELMPSFGIDPKQIGCVPSIDCYGECIVAPSEFPSNMRTGSFHIHLGNKAYKKRKDPRMLTYRSRLDLIKLMDIFVGCASIIMDNDPTAHLRRAIYGSPGNHRNTDYGAEYRVLSPGVLAHPDMTRTILDLTEYVLSHVASGTEQDVLNKVDSTVVRKAINTCDKALAETVLIAAGLPSHLMARIKAPYDQSNFSAAWGL